MKNISFLKMLGAVAVGSLLTGAAAQAQTPGSGGPTPQNPVAPATEVPIDGGASLLLASGVAYGVKKLRDRRRTPQRPG